MITSANVIIMTDKFYITIERSNFTR